MTPKLYAVYRMKKEYADKIRLAPFHRHVTECGNRFRYLPKHYKNMECMCCGHKYYTSLHLFSNKYEENNPILAPKDPNFLFNERKLQK